MYARISHKLKDIATRAMLLLALAILTTAGLGARSWVLADTCPAGMDLYSCEALYGSWDKWIPYETDDLSACSDGTATTTADIPKSILDNINKLKPSYQAAASKTGVPWQLLAAIHYRESNNDPNRDMQAGNPYGGPYSMSSTDYSLYGYPKNLAESATIAAKHLIASAGGGVVSGKINVASPNPEKVKDVLFSYNGRASAYAKQAADLGFDPVKQPYEGSPYVMNNYDKIHQGMKIILTDGGSISNVPDQRFGAFVIYSKLGGGTGGSADGCATPGSIDAKHQAILDYIKKYAWPDYNHQPRLVSTDAYRKAVQAAQANGEYVGGIQYPGVDCGGFVTRVMRNSGADPKYNSFEGYTVLQEKYMKAHPEKYKALGTQSSTKNLQPGDIAINTVHTYFYVGKLSGFNGNAAAASLDSYSPRANQTYFASLSGTMPFRWYRLIN